MKVLVAIKSPVLMDSLLSVIGEIESIKSMGHVSSSEDAIALINVIKFDLLIVEVLLRGGSGFSVLIHSRNMTHSTKVIMVSDVPYFEYINKSLELGADYFFNIALDFEAFNLTLKKICLEFPCGQNQDHKININQEAH